MTQLQIMPCKQKTWLEREGEAGSIPLKQRGLMTPHPRAPKEMLVGRRDTCPIYNLTLFTTSMKFFKIHTWHSGKEAKAVSSFDAPLCMPWAAAPLQKGATTVDFSAFPCKKDPEKGPQAPRQSNMGFHMCTDFCIKKKALESFSQLEFTRYFMIQQVSCALKIRIQTLLVGRVQPGYKFETKGLLGKY